MRSAFGIEHGEVSKARRGPGVTRQRRDPATSMTRRTPGSGYYNPSAKKVADAQARRAAQAQESLRIKQAKQFIPRGGGKAAGFAEHWRAAGKMPHVTAGILAAGGLAGYALNRRTKEVSKALSKEQQRKAENVGLGAAAGTAAGVGTMNVGGHAVKATLKERRARRGVSPHEEKIWTAHRQEHGAYNAGKNMWRAYSKYPKELPDWKLHRALAFKNRPAVSTGLVLAHTAAGAGYAMHRNKRSSNG